MTECVLCDWKLDLTAKSMAVYLPGSFYPLWWNPGSGPEQVSPSASIGSTMGGVAVVQHWFMEHPGQLMSALGQNQLEVGTWPRQAIYGSMAVAPISTLTKTDDGSYTNPEPITFSVPASTTITGIGVAKSVNAGDSFTISWSPDPDADKPPSAPKLLKPSSASVEFKVENQISKELIELLWGGELPSEDDF